MSQVISNTFDTVIHIIQNITIVDILDITFLSVVLYYVYRFIRNKRAGKLAGGVVFLFVFLVMCEAVGMRTMQFIFHNIFQVGVIAIVILFQPEFRNMLERMGASPIKGFRNMAGGDGDSAVSLAIREVVSAVSEMSESKTGALIVFQRNNMLSDIVSTGTVIDAQASAFLIRNIFYNKAPLHDGALIIADYRLYAAGCLLPLSNQSDINKDLGTRHRAALGLSENYDAVVVVVSEETGIISVAYDGNLSRGFTKDSLKQKLNDLLLSPANSYARNIAKNIKKTVHTNKTERGNK